MKGPVTPLSNRGNFALPPDGKVHIVPLGEYPVEHNGRIIVQVVDNRACQAMLANLQSEAGRANFGGLCMDFDHFRHDPAKESRAAGWVFNAEVRADGLYTAPRWSASGMAAIKGGDYRFVSPEFDPAGLEYLGGSRYRVTKLVGFGLTNAPNMRGMVALTNRHTGARIAAPEPVRRLSEVKPDGRSGRVLVEGANGRMTFAMTGQIGPGLLANSMTISEREQETEAKRMAFVEGLRADLVSEFAGSLRAADPTLTLAQSYRKAEAQVSADGDAGTL